MLEKLPRQCWVTQHTQQPHAPLMTSHVNLNVRKSMQPSRSPSSYRCLSRFDHVPRHLGYSGMTALQEQLLPHTLPIFHTFFLYTHFPSLHFLPFEYEATQNQQAKLPLTHYESLAAEDDLGTHHLNKCQVQETHVSHPGQTSLVMARKRECSPSHNLQLPWWKLKIITMYCHSFNASTVWRHSKTGIGQLTEHYSTAQDRTEEARRPGQTRPDQTKGSCST